jgi:hypothetical protein
VSSVSAGAAPIDAQWMESSATRSSEHGGPRGGRVDRPRCAPRAFADLARATPSPRHPTRILDRRRPRAEDVTTRDAIDTGRFSATSAQKVSTRSTHEGGRKHMNFLFLPATQFV